MGLDQDDAVELEFAILVLHHHQLGCLLLAIYLRLGGEPQAEVRFRAEGHGVAELDRNDSLLRLELQESILAALGVDLHGHGLNGFHIDTLPVRLNLADE